MFALLVQMMNSLRLKLNNLAPGANHWVSEYEASRKGLFFVSH